MILDKGLANTEEIRAAWDCLTSEGGILAWKTPGRKGPAKEIVDDITKLLVRYGGFTPPTSPLKSAKQYKTASYPDSKPETLAQTGHPTVAEKDTNANGSRGRGRGRGRGRARGWVPPTTATR
jgi:hypothetical protein